MKVIILYFQFSQFHFQKKFLCKLLMKVFAQMAFLFFFFPLLSVNLNYISNFCDLFVMKNTGTAAAEPTSTPTITSNKRNSPRAHFELSSWPCASGACALSAPGCPEGISAAHAVPCLAVIDGVSEANLLPLRVSAKPFLSAGWPEFTRPLLLDARGHEQRVTK